jgi:hypothetical protein
MIRAAFTLLALAALAMIDARPGVAEIYRPWCVDYGGSTNCGFTSYEQCMMTASGNNAWCMRNQWYLRYGPGQEGPRRR